MAEQHKEPIRIVPGKFYRNFDFDAQSAFAKARDMLRHRGPDGGKLRWPDADKDAMMLALLVQALVDENFALRERLDGPKDDLCPVCAGHTWGRPMLKHGLSMRMDFSKRRCSVCRWVRENPEAE